MGLTEGLEPGPVAVDTALFIYFLEEHPIFLPVVRALFMSADRGEREIVTSAITLLEVLVVPLRAHQFPLADRYEALLTKSRGIRLVEVDHGQLRTAARLRSLHGFRTPDALQLAAALTAHCSTFITNDRRLGEVPGLRTVQLSEHV